MVYLASRKGKTYAIKQISKDKLLYKNQMKYALIELRALERCRGCAYVIPLYFAFQTMEYLYLALKYISSGNLGIIIFIVDQQIKSKGKFTTA